jgi:hypothetical protein
MSLATMHLLGKRGYGLLTQTEGTLISRLIEPWQNGFTQIVGARYTVGADAHVLTMLRPLNVVTFSKAAVAGQAVVNVTADPGVYNVLGTLATANNPIQANDNVVYEAADGTFVIDTVASVALPAITLNTNLPVGGVAVGGHFWFFGLATDTNPNNNEVHPSFNALANTIFTLGRADGLVSIPDHPLLSLGGGKYQPLILQSNNVSAAGTLESVAAEYYRRPAA